jgi:hypothetical protein
MSFIRSVSILEKIAAALVVVGVILVTIGSFISFVDNSKRSFDSVTLAQDTNRNLEQRFASIDARLSEISKNLDSATSAQIEKIGLTAKVAEIDSVKKELDDIKQIIVEDPTKAIAMPLMRKDINDLQTQQQTLASSVKEQIDRIYDFSKWFLALMITLAVTLVVSLVGIVFTRKPNGQ